MINANYGQAGDHLAYGNPSGLALLEEHHQMKETLARHEEDLTVHKNRITILENQVKILTEASADYRKVRHRVFDIKKNLDAAGKARLKDGNESAHDADVIIDASLFTRRERHDESTMAEIYGIGALLVTQIAEHGLRDIINVVNLGANWRLKMKGSENVPPEVETPF
jgi:hypothetical protein